MKKALLLFFLCFGYTYLHAQSGAWTWMKGSPYVIGGVNDSLGVYGVKGVADSNNVPNPRSKMIYWKDSQGDFWFFGGTGYFGWQNDIWKYNVASNRWTWMHGPQYNTNTAGDPGLMGVPAALNVPQANANRYSWYDKAHDNLWLWQNDNKLWRYQVATNMWTWIANMPPTNTVSFGTQGVEAASNNPGNLQGAATWCDTSGNLLLFGGQGYNAEYYVDVNCNGNMQQLITNNIWKFNTNTQMWTWLKGDSLKNCWAMVATDGFNYGTLGLESPNNHMARRKEVTVWQGEDGMVYVSEGRANYSLVNYTSLLGIYRYNPQTNNWTHMSEGNSYNVTTYCDTSTHPMDRQNGANVTMGACSNDLLWRFGGSVGTTFAFPGNVNVHCYQCQTNELFVYQPSNNTWKWVSGASYPDSIPLNAGTKGVPSTSNWPDAVTGAAMWPDANGNLWLFGGGNNYSYPNGAAIPTSYALYTSNVLWRYEPDFNCVDSSFLSKPSKTSLFTCYPYVDSTTMYIPSSFSNVIITPNIGVTFNIDTSQLVFKPSTTTTYTVTAQNTNCNVNDTLIFTIDVLASLPNTPCFNFITDTVLCNWGGPLNTQLSISPDAYDITVSPMDSVHFNVDSTLITLNPSLITAYTVTAQRSCPYSGADTIVFNVIADTAHVLGPLTGNIFCNINDTIYFAANDTLSISVPPGTSLANFDLLPIKLDTTNWTIKLYANSPVNYYSQNCYVYVPAVSGTCYYSLSQFNFVLIPYSTWFNFVTDTVLCKWGGPWNTQLSISPDAYNITVSPMDSVSFNVDSTLITFNPSMVTHYTVTAQLSCPYSSDTIKFNVIADTAHALGPLTGTIFCKINDTIIYNASDTLSSKVSPGTILYNNSNSPEVWLDTTDWSVKLFSLTPINFKDLDIDIVSPSIGTGCPYRFEELNYNIKPYDYTGALAVTLKDTTICDTSALLTVPKFFYNINITPTTGYTINADSSLIFFHPDTTTTYIVYANTICGGSSQTFTIQPANVLPYNIISNSTFGRDTLTVVPVAQAYQWINCIDNTPFVNDTNQRFFVKQNGIYAAIVYNGQCVDTTNCININHLDDPIIYIVPNPSQSIFNVYSSTEFNNAEVRVFSSAGNTIIERKISGKNNISLDLSSSSRGVYFIHIIEDSRVFHAKLLKQ